MLLCCHCCSIITIRVAVVLRVVWYCMILFIVYSDVHTVGVSNIVYVDCYVSLAIDYIVVVVVVVFTVYIVVASMFVVVCCANAVVVVCDNCVIFVELSLLILLTLSRCMLLSQLGVVGGGVASVD